MREASRSELDRRDIGAARINVLEVGEHEAVLEAFEEVARDPLLRREQVTRNVVVGIEHHLQVRRRKALEHSEKRYP